MLQLYSQAPGAMDADVSSSAGNTDPLRILQQYSAGLAFTESSKRIILAQLADAPDQFLLLATLDTVDVDTFLAGTSLTNVGLHQGHMLQAIDGTGLQLVKLDDKTLAIGSSSALQKSLDSRVGAASSIRQGPLSSYLIGLDSAFANTAIYGLPALYGAVVPPGNGTTSLSQARAVSASFDVQSGGILSGFMGFYSDSAVTFTNKLKSELTGFPTPVLSALNGLVIVGLTGLSIDNDVRPLLKTLVLDMDTVDYAAAVVHGGNLPWLNFNVGEDPAAIFVNFEFEPGQIAAFEADHLPPGFNLVPFHMMEGEPDRYLMVLNIYRSSGGLVEGARAEWSVFVADPDSGEPRFMVIEAKAESIAADSVNGLTFGEPVDYAYSQSGDALVSRVGVANLDPPHYFRVDIPWPQPPSTHVPFARSFMPANDFVFWGNAVADKTLYNSTAANRNGAVVPAGQFTLTDNSIWKNYLKQDLQNNTLPVNAVIYLNNQEIVISPWWNLDADYLDVLETDDTPNPNVAPLSRQDLIQFKNNFYPLTVKNNAQRAIRGQMLAPMPFTSADTVPSAYYHFPLLDPIGLRDAVEGTFTPAPIALFDGEPAAHYVTLAVSKRENDRCGIRGEWITYVTGTDGRPETVQLDTFAGNSCLDSAVLLTMATDISHGVSGSSLATRISSPFTQFEASVDLNGTDDVLAGLDWLESMETVCSLKGICDELFYDGQLVTVPGQRADEAATMVTTIETPWDSYIDTAAARTGVRQNTVLQAVNSWRNLSSFRGKQPGSLSASGVGLIPPPRCVTALRQVTASGASFHCQKIKSGLTVLF